MKQTKKNGFYYEISSFDLAYEDYYEEDEKMYSEVISIDEMLILIVEDFLDDLERNN